MTTDDHIVLQARREKQSRSGLLLDVRAAFSACARVGHSIVSFHQSWKCIRGLFKIMPVFRRSLVDFHDGWTEGSVNPLGKAFLRNG